MPLARATTTGISALVDARGVVIARAGLFERRVVTADVHPVQVRSPYEAAGEWFAWTCVAFSASMLGVKDEYIPASWTEANAQATQVLDPILSATPEGIALADILLDLAQLDLNGDGRSFLRPPLHALTRYMLGDQVTNSLQIPREAYWDDLVAWAWPRFVAIREGALLVPLAPAVAWVLDEVLRTGWQPEVLVVREAPLSEIHLENMLRLSRMGAVVLPPMPAFYNHPRTVDDVVEHTVSRVLDQFGLDAGGSARWTGEMGIGAEVD